MTERDFCKQCSKHYSLHTALELKEHDFYGRKTKTNINKTSEEFIQDFDKSGLGIAIKPLQGVEYRAYLAVMEASGNSFSTEDAREIAKGILSRYAVVDFLNEVEEQGWDLDADDIKHILNSDFDYVRKQWQTVEKEGSS